MLLNLKVSCRATKIVHDSAVACPSKTSLEWLSKEKSHQCHRCSFFLVRIPSSLDKATTTPSLSPPRQLFHFASKPEGRQLFVCVFLVNLVNWSLPNCISQNTSQLDSKCDKFLPIPKADTVMPKLFLWLKDSLHSGQMFTCKSVKAPLTDAAPLWNTEKSHWPQD